MIRLPPSPAVQNTSIRWADPERILFIAAALLFILGNYKFQLWFNWPYRIVFLATMFLTLACKRLVPTILSVQMAPLLASWGVLATFVMTQHGDRIVNSFYMLSRAIPLFVLGFRLATTSRYRRLLLASIVLGYASVSAIDLLSFQGTFSGGVERDAVVLSLTGAADMTTDVEAVQPLIYHFAALGFVVILSFGLYDVTSRWAKLVVFSCDLILIAMIVISTWAAALSVVGIGLMVILLLGLRGRAVSRKVVLWAIGVGAFFIVRMSVMKFTASSTGHRFSAIFAAIGDWDRFWTILDDMSGTRLSLARLSISGFLNYPFAGSGDSYLSAHVGGHSFIFDSLGRYGVFGGLPMLGMFVQWTVAAARNYSADPRSKENIAWVALLVSFLVTSLLNPYFLTSTFDFVLAFSGGVVCGRRANHVQQKCAIRPAGMAPST